MPPKPVEIRIPARTILTIVAVAGLIALALVSLGTLISILLAAVLVAQRARHYRRSESASPGDELPPPAATEGQIA